MIYTGDCLDILPTLDAESVQCCVTSPPYWGLRDYGCAGQIGLEPTPEAYVEKLVAVFREVRRVLRDDGCLFLNLGSSYASGDKNPSQSHAVSHVPACDTDGIEQSGLIEIDPACPHCDDERQGGYQTHQIHTSRNAIPLHEGASSPLMKDHDTEHQGLQEASPDAFPHDVPQSILPSSCAESLQNDSTQSPVESGLPCVRSLLDGGHPFADKKACLCEYQIASSSTRDLSGNTLDNGGTDGALASRKADKASDSFSLHPPDGLIRDNITTMFHNVKFKPKDLVPIPWMVAMALQADGWWLRQDIIWNKPNPMPESVTDRCTKAHEYIFLLTKSAKYFYDAEAVKEEAICAGVPQTFARPCRTARAFGKPSGSELHGDRTHESGTRNRRSVWTITTKPFKEAHFATFPPEIPEICIKAGSKLGDTILDPFSGAGTTGNVAERLGRKYIGIELNPTYSAMGEKRIEAARMPLLEEA